MTHRFAVLALALPLLAACGGSPAPQRTAAAGPDVAPLPSGGCYDAPLEMTVNGAPHVLRRTGPETFVASGPVFSALAIRLATDGERALIGTQRGLRPLEGDPASCRLSGEGALAATQRNMPIAIAIAPPA